MKSVIICGGHFSPAISVIEKLKDSKNIRIIYIGIKHALEGDDAISLEYSTVNRLKIPFYSIHPGRFQRYLSPFSFISFLKIPYGIIQSFIILCKVKPSLIVSFGGFVALPVCIAGFILGIPIITHEQTTILGLSNRIISKLAKCLFLSYKDTLNIPKGIKYEVIGNPIRNTFLQKGKSKICNFGNKAFPLIFVTGGSLGARSINLFISKVISILAKRYRILHQCGSAENKIDYKNLLLLRNKLSSKVRNNYKILTHVNPTDVGCIYHFASLIIGRSGANTVSEISVMLVPAILIPLPWSADNEQYRNAIILKNANLAEIIKQDKLEKKTFLNTVEKMISKKNQHSKKVSYDFTYHKNSADKFEKIIQRYCQSDSK